MMNLYKEFHFSFLLPTACPSYNNFFKPNSSILLFLISRTHCISCRITCCFSDMVSKLSLSSENRRKEIYYLSKNK